MTLRALLVSALLLAPAAWAGPVRGLTTAGARGKADRLVRALDHKHGFARELAARKLAGLEPTDGGRTALIACVERDDERGYVRAACAFALSRWGVAEADQVIIDAMAEVDPESRYWMAEALHTLGTGPARAHLASLQSDPDLYLAASAREWAR